MDVIRELQNSKFFVQPFPDDTVVAMAYVPYQNPTELYSPEHGIQKGTLFPNLDKPFLAAGNNGGMSDE